MPKVIDKHGEESLKTDDRVMVDGALVGTVDDIDYVSGLVYVRIDGAKGRTMFPCEPVVWQAPELESLGDEINLVMREAQGQPA